MDYGSVLVDDAFLPSQYADLHRSSQLTPERKLMLAILRDALRMIVRGPGDMPASRRRADYTECQAWVAATADHPFSYLSMCGELGIDAARLRLSIATGIVRVPRGGSLNGVVRARPCRARGSQPRPVRSHV